PCVPNPRVLRPRRPHLSPCFPLQPRFPSCKVRTVPTPPLPVHPLGPRRRLRLLFLTMSAQALGSLRHSLPTASLSNTFPPRPAVHRGYRRPPIRVLEAARQRSVSVVC